MKRRYRSTISRLKGKWGTFKHGNRKIARGGRRLWKAILY